MLKALWLCGDQHGAEEDLELPTSDCLGLTANHFGEFSPLPALPWAGGLWYPVPL